MHGITTRAALDFFSYAPRNRMHEKRVTLYSFIHLFPKNVCVLMKLCTKRDAVAKHVFCKYCLQFVADLSGIVVLFPREVQ